MNHFIKLLVNNYQANELNYLRKHYLKVICPNNDLGELGSIKRYLKIVEWADLVVFSEYNDHIGTGVYDEVKHALANKIPVRLLRNFELLRIKELTIIPQSNSTRYAKVIL